VQALLLAYFLVFSLYSFLVLSYFWRFLGRIVCFILRRRSLICLLYLPNPDHPHYFQFLFTLLYPFFLPFSFPISSSFLPRHSKLLPPTTLRCKICAALLVAENFGFEQRWVLFLFFFFAAPTSLRRS